MAMSPERRQPRPLDADALDRLALRYVERFATTQGKLADYLRRKVRERGWTGVPIDPAAVAGRMAALGYVDDRGYAESKAASLARRGLGARRVNAALREAHVADHAEAIGPAINDRAVSAALTFAKRRRIGPFGPPADDRALREKQLAAMLRAGHPLDLSRRILSARDPAEIADAGDDGRSWQEM